MTLAGILDPATHRWSGGSSFVVQVGDIFDRGGNEIKLIYLLHRLKHEATLAGGNLVTILGNHEVMNMNNDFRYVTREGLMEFERWGWWFKKGMDMKKLGGDEDVRDVFDGLPESFRGVDKEYWNGFRARMAALRPKGPIAGRFLQDYQTVAVVGDSVFVHGGLLKEHVQYGLEKINSEARDWIRGSSTTKTNSCPDYLLGGSSVVWLRKFSYGSNCDCEQLQSILSLIPGAARMVMGHTIQREGINSVCDNQALRIDVGLSKGCGNGIPEVLEITRGKEIRVLTSNLLYRRSDPMPDKKKPEFLAPEVQVKA